MIKYEAALSVGGTMDKAVSEAFALYQDCKDCSDGKELFAR